MPSFPDSVFAPANRSNGQTIDASHMNGVQDEIVAIEGGYRNGTAPLNSSNSTVANLSVTGGSTFGSRPVLPPPDAVKLGLSDTAALAAGTTGAISWTRQDVITNSSMHSTTTNPTLVTPQTTGVYMCAANLYFSNPANGAQFVNIEDSSGTFIAHVQSIGTTGLRSVNISGLKRFDVLASTQWVRIVAQGGATTNSLTTIAGYTQFGMWKL
jgi:hypothetical protein